jgi:nucleotidyltransferase/DNA polymerase involved in DNA repair
MSTADNEVQWLFLDLNAFFASCGQQENPAPRGKPVMAVQTRIPPASISFGNACCGPNH